MPQSIHTWLMSAKSLRLRATPFNVRMFPMTRSARLALVLIRDGLVEVELLITNAVDFRDPAAIVLAFPEYGVGGPLKTSVIYQTTLAGVIPVQRTGAVGARV